MPVQSTDLLVIQQAGVQYKVSAATLKAFFDTVLTPATPTALGGIKVGKNLDISADGTLDADINGALVYMGVLPPTDAPPATPRQGDCYVFNAAGTLTAAGWGGLRGRNVAVRDMVAWDGDEWSLLVNAIGGGGTVIAVTGTAPVMVNNADPAEPDISVANAVPSVGGTGGSAGLITAQNQEKLNSIAPGAAIGTVTRIDVNAPLVVTNPSTIPVLDVSDATTTTEGVVRLADAAAITAGTAKRVVDAAQLKVVADAVATAAAGGITTVVGTAPISVTGTGASRTVAVAAATDTTPGVLRIATASETVAGTATDLAISPVNAKTQFMPRDIASLSFLP